VTRVVAVGIPERLKQAMRAALPDAVVVDDPIDAVDVLDVYPDAALIYGEELFGAIVTGQPIMFLPEQKPDPGAWFGPVARVLVLIDHQPTKLDELEFDDPRRLVMQAGVRVLASHLVDVSEFGAWHALSVLLDDILTPPRLRG
jgi:SpoU rRNA methylase family enzyme